MRERSHKKGETYQHAVKHWLVQTTLFGFRAELFGDAYDVTKNACTHGGIVFDFSLTLRRGDVAHRILYAECKYRDERRGNVDSDFTSFLDHVRLALTSAENDSANNAVFLFVSNIPPKAWREFIKARRKFCSGLWKPDSPPDAVLDRMATNLHLLILSEPMIERS